MYKHKGRKFFVQSEKVVARSASSTSAAAQDHCHPNENIQNIQVDRHLTEIAACYLPIAASLSVKYCKTKTEILGGTGMPDTKKIF